MTRDATTTLLVGLLVGVVIGGAGGFAAGRSAHSSVEVASGSASRPSRSGFGADVARSGASEPDEAKRLLAERTSERDTARDTGGPGAPLGRAPTDAGDPDLRKGAKAVADRQLAQELKPLRERLLVAAASERRRLLEETLARLSSLSPEARARVIHELFKSEGWTDESACPPLDREMWDLAASTLQALDEQSDDARGALLGTLALQMQRARGVDALAEMVAVGRTSIAVERERLEPSSATGPTDDALRAVRRLLAEQGTAPAREPTLSSDILARGVLALGGANASLDDRQLLMRLAADGTSRRVRAGSYVALGTSSEDPAVDGFLLEQARAPGRDWPERLLAWMALRRRGREELLPASIRRDILDAWTGSGVTSFEKALGE